MSRILKALLPVAIVAALSAGCGSGGGGGSTTPASYTVSPMVMSTATAPKAAVGATQATDTATGMQSKGSALRRGVSGSKDSLMGKVSSSFSNIRAMIQDLAPDGSARVSALTFPIPADTGACGGSMSGSMTVDDPLAPTSMSASIAFVNFDDCFSVLNGTVFVSASYTSTTATTTITYSGFTEKDKDSNETEAISGTMTVTGALDGSSGSATATITASDGEHTMALTGYVETFTLQNSGQDISLTVDGTVAYDNASFSITTVTPVVIVGFETAEQPSSGQFVLDATGKARITYLTANTVRVEVDPTESGTYTQVFEGTWAALEALAGS